MKTRTLFLSIFFFSFFTTTSISQVNDAAIMPLRVKMNISQSAGMFSGIPMSHLSLNPKSDPNSLTEYENQFLPILRKTLLKTLKAEGLNVTSFQKKSTTEEEEQIEEKLYNAIGNEFSNYSMENSKALFKSKAAKGMKQTGKNTKEQSKKYSKELKTKILVYYNFIGYHRLKKKASKSDPLPENAKGNLSVMVWFVDAKTGMIVDDLSIQMFKKLQTARKPVVEKPIAKTITSKHLESFARKIAKKTKSKVKKLSK